jgi:hypothetical protein
MTAINIEEPKEGDEDSEDSKEVGLEDSDEDTFEMSLPIPKKKKMTLKNNNMSVENELMSKAIVKRKQW